MEVELWRKCSIYTCSLLTLALFQNMLSMSITDLEVHNVLNMFTADLDVVLERAQYAHLCPWS
jgi:hypothetical protein